MIILTLVKYISYKVFFTVCTYDVLLANFIRRKETEKKNDP